MTIEEIRLSIKNGDKLVWNTPSGKSHHIIFIEEITDDFDDYTPILVKYPGTETEVFANELSIAKPDDIKIKGTALEWLKQAQHALKQEGYVSDWAGHAIVNCIDQDRTDEICVDLKDAVNVFVWTKSKHPYYDKAIKRLNYWNNIIDFITTWERNNGTFKLK